MQEPQYPLLDVMKTSDIIAEWGCQDEICPTTGRKHKQGFLRTVRQVRFRALQIAFPGLHIETARNWNALVNYCKKKETRDISGSFLSGTGSGKTPLTMAYGLMKLCAYASPILNYQQNGKGALYVDELDPINIDKMYISGGENWLRDDPNVIGLISNNQWKGAFVNFFKVWQEYARELAFAECDGDASLVLQDAILETYAFLEDSPKVIRKQKMCLPSIKQNGGDAEVS